MKSRVLASVALGAAVVLGATGCSMISPQSTTIQYSPADGMNVPLSGPLAVRNALVVADERGTVGNFVAAIVNDTDAPHVLSLQVGEGADAIRASIRVPASTTLSLGQDEPPLTLDGIDTKPGATLAVYFQSGDAEGVRQAIPVLDGRLDYLRPLAPRTPAEIVVEGATGAATPSPTPSASATSTGSHSSGH